MEDFNQIFIILSNQTAISLNTNIFETGLINIIALLAILIFTGRDFLGSLLTDRKKIIIEGVQDAENRLNDSQKRLLEAQKQLSQADLIIKEIQNETISTKKLLLESEAFEAKKDLKIRFERAFSTFRAKERQIFLEIKQQIVTLVLKRTIIKTQESFQSKDRIILLFNKNLNKLEGGLL